MSHHLKFKTPFTALIASPTSSGKTVLTRRILTHHKEVFHPRNPSILNVLWAYGQWQPLYDVPLPSVQITYVNGMSSSRDMLKQDVIVLDDLTSELENDKQLLKLFTKGSHHNN